MDRQDGGKPADPGPLDDILQEARRILGAAEEAGVLLRLIGGTGVKLVAPSAREGVWSRGPGNDIDLVGLSKQGRAIEELFVALGYQPNPGFNLLHGGRRLQMMDIPRQRIYDIFLDVFEMCHSFRFADRLTLKRETLPIADLLVTKLQIVHLNEKDVRDIVALLADCEIGLSHDEIDISRILSMCARDWGLFTTCLENLRKVTNYISNNADGPSDHLTAKVESICELMIEAPKSLRWRSRALVGRRLLWYELPEAPDRAFMDNYDRS